MSSRTVNWKSLGQLVNWIVSLYTLIRDTFTELTIGIEILPWLLGDGKKSFVEKFLKPLGQEFLAMRRVRVLNENTILVNLGATPKLPFEGAELEAHIGENWAQLQKRPDGLYVGNCKVLLYLSEHQQGNINIRGYELREELSFKAVLNANILDALLDYPHLIPEEWEKDEYGKTRYIFFWATVYRVQSGGQYVRFLNWRNCRWYSSHDCLAGCLGSAAPAASLN